MNEFKKIIRLAFVLGAAAVAFVSCKDDEEEDTRSYLDGSVAITSVGAEDMPQYVKPGDKFVFTASGVSCKKDPSVAIKYYFTNPFTNVRDTLNAGEKFSFTIADTLSTFSLNCTAFASNSNEYYTTSTTRTFIVVSPELNSGSLTEFPIYEDEMMEKIGDKSYYVAQIGSKSWMRQNLASVSEGFGRCYFDSKAMLDIMGGYYTWEEACKACPDGWRLPSEADWVDLCKASGAKDAAEFCDIEGAAAGLMAYTKFNREPMWEYYRGVKATDKTHFTCIPTGYAVVAGDDYQFTGYSNYAAYWTSSEKNGEGVYRYIYKDKDIVYAGSASKTGFAASVRCVR